MRPLGGIRRRRDNERGVALVEFALILPALVLLVMGVLDFGRAIHYWLEMNHLANEGARWVVVDKPLGTGLEAYLRNEADVRALRSGGTRSTPAPLQVCVTYPEGNAQNNRAVVRVTVRYNWLPALGALGVDDAVTDTLTGSATMRIEKAGGVTNHPPDGTC